eukprot:365247-Chlamydomonas_euryale.AAC.4
MQQPCCLVTHSGVPNPSSTHALDVIFDVIFDVIWLSRETLPLHASSGRAAPSRARHAAPRKPASTGYSQASCSVWRTNFRSFA